VGALKTSEQADVIAGEGKKDPTSDDRPVDSGAKIIIGPEGIAPPTRAPVAPPAPAAPRAAAPPVPRTVAEPRRGGMGLVIVVYLLAAAALGYAIYERFVA
jgi:hypothetical protein